MVARSGQSGHSAPSIAGSLCELFWLQQSSDWLSRPICVCKRGVARFSHSKFANISSVFRLSPRTKILRP